MAGAKARGVIAGDGNGARDHDRVTSEAGGVERSARDGVRVGRAEADVQVTTDDGETPGALGRLLGVGLIGGVAEKEGVLAVEDDQRLRLAIEARDLQARIVGVGGDAVEQHAPAGAIAQFDGAFNNHAGADHDVAGVANAAGVDTRRHRHQGGDRHQQLANHALHHTHTTARQEAGNRTEDPKHGALPSLWQDTWHRAPSRHIDRHAHSRRGHAISHAGFGPATRSAGDDVTLTRSVHGRRRRTTTSPAARERRPTRITGFDRRAHGAHPHHARSMMSCPMCRRMPSRRGSKTG